MTQSWTVEDMAALGQLHVTHEVAQDMESLMATLVAEPVYEFYPLGKKLVGNGLVRLYYKHFNASVLDRMRSMKTFDEWTSLDSSAMEVEMLLDIDGEVQAHRVLGVLYRDGVLLGGERIYAAEPTIRLMLGPLFSELEDL